MFFLCKSFPSCKRHSTSIPPLPYHHRTSILYSLPVHSLHHLSCLIVLNTFPTTFFSPPLPTITLTDHILHHTLPNTLTRPQHHSLAPSTAVVSLSTFPPCTCSKGGVQGPPLNTLFTAFTLHFLYVV